MGFMKAGFRIFARSGIPNRGRVQMENAGDDAFATQLKSGRGITMVGGFALLRPGGYI
jgi:hypothetical protein